MNSEYTWFEWLHEFNSLLEAERGLTSYDIDCDDVLDEYFHRGFDPHEVIEKRLYMFA